MIFDISQVDKISFDFVYSFLMMAMMFVHFETCVRVFIKCVGAETALCHLFEEWSCYVISLVLWYKAHLYTGKFIGTLVIIICRVTWNPD